MNIVDSLHIDQGIPMVQSQFIGAIGGFPISNSMTTNLLTTTILAFITFLVYSDVKANRNSKIRAFFEIVYETMYDFVNNTTGNEAVTKHIIKLSATVFLYLTIANTITSLPPFNFLTYQNISLFRGQTSDFSTTFGLAACLIILANAKGVQSKGPLGYINEFIPMVDLYKNMTKQPKKAMAHIANFFLGFFMGILDMIGELGKTLSISLRLFGNMYAGQILLVVSMSLFSYILPAFLVLFNLFSGVLQALIFTALISVYFTAHHRGDEEVEVLAS